MSSTPTILYVEDEADDVYFMRAAFKRAGISADFQAAIDGDKAIAYLSGQNGYADRTKHPLPVMMFLDLNLPLRSGFEVLEWARKQGQFEKLPIVVFSSSGRPEDRARAEKLGATEYMLKPSSGAQFADVVDAVKSRWIPSWQQV